MKVAVFTSGRQDWGILAPVVRELGTSKKLSVSLIACGMHCRNGYRPSSLDGHAVDLMVPILPEGDDDHGIARAAGETTIAIAEALVRLKAEALLVLGDRSETLAAGLAATCLRLPIIHLHGGEETAGAIDNTCRHALTKLAHLHAVAHPSFRDRLVTMGERHDRVVVSGAPAIDAMLATPPVAAQALAEYLGVVRLGSPLLILTHHPTTLGEIPPHEEIAAVLAGVERALIGLDDACVVMTRANADAGGAAVNDMLTQAAARDPRFIFANDLGSPRYWSLLAQAQVMIGNSSSGILEAPSFDLPVVNIGDRQRGRLRVHHVVDVPPEAHAITTAIVGVLQQKRQPGPPTPSAYGDGRAAQRIRAAVESLAAQPPHIRLSKEQP